MQASVAISYFHRKIGPIVYYTFPEEMLIDEAHDLDTNQYCARVTLADSDLVTLRADLAVVGFRQYEGKLPSSPQ